MTELDYVYQSGAYKALVEMFVNEVNKVNASEQGSIAREVYERNLKMLADQAEETLKKYEMNG